MLRETPKALGTRLYRSDLIRARLAVAGITQEEMGKATGLASGTVTKVCRGERVYPDTLHTVAKFLNIEMKELFTFETEQAA